MQAMPKIDWFVTITALIYVFLAAKENVWCWIFGIASCSAWAYSSYTNYNLYLDALLNVFYVIISFWGIYQWKVGNKNQDKLTITKMNQSLHLKIIVGGLILSILYGYLFDKYTTAEATYLDALTTVFAVITTFLVIYKKLENWLYWIVINLLYVYIYASREAYLFVIIMVIYVVIAISGHLTWTNKWKRQTV